jgi:hypothetical protein
VVSDYLSIKIREGMAKADAEHPDLFATPDTPESLQAEADLNKAMTAWKQGGSLEDVRTAFKRWTDSLAAARQQVRLFG